MKKENIGIIYKATFPNGKCYIGQTIKNLNSRKSSHFGNMNREHVVFHNAINKHGRDCIEWEIIDTAFSIEELNDKEKHWINFFNSYVHAENSNGYNMTLGGNSTLGWIPSEETKRKISSSHVGIHSGDKNFQYGKTGELSTWWGRKHTEEEKQKISLANKGKLVSQETREKISSANKGKRKGIPNTPEQKAKISISKMGHSVSLETRNKISETKRKNSLNKK